MRNRKVFADKYFTSVTAIAIFNGFSHSFHDFHPLFYTIETRLKSGGTITRKKTKSEVLNDIYIMIKSIYPNDRYLAVDINFN